MAIATDSALLRLLQLSSAALPVGGYAFSQGMESAIEAGWLADEPAVQRWLEQQLLLGLARVDVPILLRSHCAASAGDTQTARYLNALALACRETAELRLTDTAMGAALAKLLGELAVPVEQGPGGDTSFVTAFAAAAAHWRIDADSACHGYLWSWLENQVAAATKLVPLGQTAAQRLLGKLLPALEAALASGAQLRDEDIGSSLPALALVSSWHEQQYSRLFRS